MTLKSIHYIAMSGQHGCLPDHCEVFETYADAVSDLVQLFDLGRTRAARLRKNSYLELTPTPIEINRNEDFGAEYCEITECSCENPSVHSDSGQEFESDSEHCTRCSAELEEGQIGLCDDCQNEKSKEGE